MTFMFITTTIMLLAANRAAAKPRGIGGGGSSGSSTCYDNNGNVVACPVNKTAIIAGVVVGVVAAILIVTFAIILWRRKRARSRGLAASNVPANNLSTTEKGYSLDHTEKHESIKMPEPAHTQVPVAAPGTFAPPPGPPPA
ncbi:hypothetical protein FRC19_000069 [Serendipita sp. 401]|nr:hypothetical protein FRC19_000069 [Serendipita sp. 401]KAG8869183.1 hypothetical protein FRC20_002010 [Serendipita sp. 405]KAG9058868.1 hypothetical protein FS842_000065 [Serendipita sp. 407]